MVFASFASFVVVSKCPNRLLLTFFTRIWMIYKKKNINQKEPETAISRIIGSKLQKTADYVLGMFKNPHCVLTRLLSCV